MTRLQKTKLKLKAKKLTDILGDLKEDKKLLCQSIDDMSEQIKEILKKTKINELEGKYYKSLYDSYKKDSTDWKSLAMTFKPTKRKIRKFTTTEDVERLRTYQL